MEAFPNVSLVREIRLDIVSGCRRVMVLSPTKSLKDLEEQNSSNITDQYPLLSRYELGSMLRDWRNQAGLSLRKMGIKLAINFASVNHYETGHKRTPKWLYEMMLKKG